MFLGFILSLKHYIIFIIAMFLLILHVLVMSSQFSNYTIFSSSFMMLSYLLFLITLSIILFKIKHGSKKLLIFSISIFILIFLNSITSTFILYKYWIIGNHIFDVNNINQNLEFYLKINGVIYLGTIVILLNLSKSILICEKKENSAANVIYYMILLYLLPIGIWILQPKINKIYREYLEAQKNENAI